jgi:NADH:ubiquinone oxidoreductase subunit F (NADH-binding)
MGHLRQHFLLPELSYESYAEYLEHKGSNAVVTAREMGAEAVLDELRRSGLRGRGGSGFSTAVKWQAIYGHPCPTRYVVCNAAEGEPGTFKDRYLLRRNPYATIEGMLIAAHVVGARDLYVAVKGSFRREIARLEAAIREIEDEGLLEYHEIHLVEGPEEYLFGEEKALLEVIEGNDPLPREPHAPPYEVGLFATPTSPNPALVNNVETFAHVPSIVRSGGASFAEVGTRDTSGTLLFTVSGDVARPGVYELPAGVTLATLFHEVAGGPREGRTFKAALSGVSSAVILADKFDTPADFASLALVGASLGSAGFIVLDDQASVPRVAQAVARFLYVESCNQCSACKHGLRVAWSAIDELFDPALATDDDYERAYYGARHAPQGNRCYLPVGAAAVLPSLLTRFRPEFDAQLAAPSAAPPPYVVPKMVDYDDATATFTYDEAQARKTPSWTYEDENEDEPPASRARAASPGVRPAAPVAARLAGDVRERLALLAEHRGIDVDTLVNEVIREWLKERRSR